MNKRAFFIPLLLLIAQPNQILSADTNFDQAKEDLERYFHTNNKDLPETVVMNGMYTSENSDVQKLLKIAREVGDKERGEVEFFMDENKISATNSHYHPKAIDIIKKHYPKAIIKEKAVRVRAAKHY